MNHCFGKPANFAFEIDPIHEAFCPTRLWLGGELVWAYENDAPISLSPISFLYHLAVYWNEIFNSQSPPSYEKIIVSAENPEQAVTFLLNDIIQSVTPDMNIEEEKFFIYEKAHNIGLWDDEVFCRQDIYIFKLDSEVQISCEEKKVYCNIFEIQSLLNELGDFLCEQVHSVVPDSHAISAWIKKEQFKPIF